MNTKYSNTRTKIKHISLKGVANLACDCACDCACPELDSLEKTYLFDENCFDDQTKKFTSEVIFSQ